MDNGRLTADEMDDIRKKNIAYQYLCHLEEAKNWMELCITEDLPEVGMLDQQLSHGVYLAKLAHFFSPSTVPLKKIFDADLVRFKTSGLHFRHTDNINHFLRALREIGLPQIFHPETTDIYECKNTPRTVFCLHALALHLFKMGIAPHVQNLYGKVQFSDEVMEAMMNELNKFGCQLPQFSKIGGILASELPVDEAALHASIIAINDAIRKQDHSELISTLTNSNCHLTGVDVHNVPSYLPVLFRALERKVDIAFNKSRDESFIPDAYDELLTQAEIQGHVNHVNVMCVMDRIEEALNNEDSSTIITLLQSSILGLKGVRNEFAVDYKNLMSEDGPTDRNLNESISNGRFSKRILQDVINEVNKSREKRERDSTCLSRLNRCLSTNSSSDTLDALKLLESHLPPLFDYASPLYHEEMKTIREDAQSDLSLEEVIGGVRLLSAIGRINFTLNRRNLNELWKHLSHPEAYIQELNFAFLSDYQHHLVNCFERKSHDDECPLLTYSEIESVISEVNEKKENDERKVQFLSMVNEAVLSNDLILLSKALRRPELQLNNYSKHIVGHCLTILKKIHKSKQNLLNESDAELWLEDLIEMDKSVGDHLSMAADLSTLLTKVNSCLQTGDKLPMDNLAGSSFFSGIVIKKDIGEVVHSKLTNITNSNPNASDSPWVCCPFPSKGFQVYINVVDCSYAFEEPRRFNSDSKFVNLENIEIALKDASLEMDFTTWIESIMVRLQAVCRSHLCRKNIQKRSNAAIKIQSWWRMVTKMRTYNMYQLALQMCEPQIIIIQRAVRKWLHKRRITNLDFRFKEKEHYVIVIQRAWRHYKAVQNLHLLTSCKNPPLSVIRRFIHLLQVSTKDFEEEIRLQRLKSDVVKSIRRSHDLELKIEQMDVRIGLLVQNRITMKEAISIDKENINPNNSSGENTIKRSKKFKDFERSGTMRSVKGLKALTKDSRERLSGYQHLFYLLQTQPHYLAQLIFTIPQGRTTKFIENVIFSLYNYGTNERDHYLLLKLLKTALEEEIRCRVLRLNDIVIGNPLVVKMVVSFNRKGDGQAMLREMLEPLVEKVLNDGHLHINTNPVEIYKMWVNQMETNSGQPSGLPYGVSHEEALKYPEVQTRLMRAIASLREATDIFCTRITSSRHLIPYGMQYMSKIMKNSLIRRFPHLAEKDILKVIGNFLYYRYINSAIVAPDAFDIVTVAPDKKLTNDQRRNLASIAKILQFAASKKGFAEEASHLMNLNPFIIECHEKFRIFFKECCEVEDPEAVFNVHQYSEATLIIKPTVYISLQEICETHQLLLQFELILGPDSDDPLHALLGDLGEKPSLQTLIGDAQGLDMPNTISALGRTEICLALSAKPDKVAIELDKTETKDQHQKLFLKTKQLLIDLIQCVEGSNVGALAFGATLPNQEETYRAIVSNRLQQETTAKSNDTGLNRSNSFLGEARVSLHEVKTRVSHSLRRLENQGLTSRKDDHQSLLNAIAEDIVNQRKRRIQRRADLQQLTVTSRRLDTKEQFYKDQLNSYDTYLQTCLVNMNIGKRNIHYKVGNNSKSSKKITLKYSALRLREKGILLSIEDLQPQQFKNVVFEITPTETTGVFSVMVKFMGVGMETVQLDMQDLLQLQYEGVSVKQMMGKAHINVNLLLHLLNTKFYCKKK